jgi:hypothetical protein
MKRIVFALALACMSSSGGAVTVALGAEQAADAEAEMARADEHMKQRNWQAAVAHYNAAKLLAPDRPGPYRGLGMAYYAAGQCAEAIPALEEYMRKKQRDAWPQAARALEECRARAGGQRGGTIHVISDPSGSLVRIDDPDGPVLGSTPFDSESLTPGVHRIYLSRPDFRPTVSEVQVSRGQSSTVQVTLAPIPPLPTAPAPTARETEDRRRALEEYEQSSSVELQVREQVRVRYEHEKMEICGSGTEWKFCTAGGAITENDFIRRYEKVTKQKDLHHALKMRNNVATGLWASIGLAGVAVMAYGLATLNRPCNPNGDSSKSDCMTNMMFDPTRTTTDDLSEKLAIIGGAVQVGTSLIYLIYGLKPDGTVTSHLLTEYDARNIVDRYNRALERKIRQDLYLNRTAEPLGRDEKVIPSMAPARASAAKVRISPTVNGVLIQF